MNERMLFYGAWTYGPFGNLARISVKMEKV